METDPSYSPNSFIYTAVKSKTDWNLCNRLIVQPGVVVCVFNPSTGKVRQVDL